MFRSLIWWTYARLVAAALSLTAIFTQLVVLLNSAATATTPWASHVPTIIANYFSFFTIDSNLTASVFLIAGGVWALTTGRDKEREPRWLAVGMACAATYMLVTGIIFNVLLRGIPLPMGVTRPWTSEVLHVVIPLFMLADVFFAPKRRRLSWGTLVTITAIPILWAIYSVLRAHTVVDPTSGAPYWYPYPFLNPLVTPGGLAGVTGYVAGTALVFIAAGAIVVGVARRRDAPGGGVRTRSSNDSRISTGAS